MCKASKIQNLQQITADLHAISEAVRHFQDQQRAIHLLDGVVDRLAVLSDQTQDGDVSLHFNIILARTNASDATVLMLNNDGLVDDVANVASSLAVVARWHAQKALRAAQRGQWGIGTASAG